jgi:peptidoglycan/LPS O-acetylase OafA/YrhL
MQIDVLKPLQETIIFGVVFFALLLFSLRKKKSNEFLPVDTTQELKGFAICFITLAHIGYFLSRQTEFLFPFSVFAGVGVDIFLFLSGYGLTLSALRKPFRIKEFYQKRLTKIFVPLWITLLLFLILDYFVLGRVYPLKDIVWNFFGVFPRADIFFNINAPLWYITPTLFYYILFPLFFFRKKPLLSALALYLLGWLLIQFPLPVHEEVMNLYQTHFVAFPLGVLCASLFAKINPIKIKAPLHFLLLPTLLFAAIYFGIHSGVGKGEMLEQFISLVILFLVLAFFIVKPFGIQMFSLLGVYSYEIYLLHWPLLSRYDVIYKYLPAGIATMIYGFIFLCLGICLQYLIKKFFFNKKTS